MLFEVKLLLLARIRPLNSASLLVDLFFLSGTMSPEVPIDPQRARVFLAPVCGVGNDSLHTMR